MKKLVGKSPTCKPLFYTRSAPLTGSDTAAPTTQRANITADHPSSRSDIIIFTSKKLNLPPHSPEILPFFVTQERCSEKLKTVEQVLELSGNKKIPF